jgi:hypothetical protein
MLKDKRGLYIIIALAIVFTFMSIRNDFGWGDDFAQYILQAKAIISGDKVHFISNNTIRINYSDVCIGPVTYPWGFPLLICTVIATLGMNYYVLQLLVCSFYIFFLFALFSLFRNKLNKFQLLALVAIFAFNPYIFEFRKNINSDIPFLFFSTMSIYFIQKDIVLKNVSERKYLNSFLLGFLIFFAMFLRTAGITLLVAFALVQAFVNFKSKKIRLVEWIPVLFCLILYFLANKFLAPEKSTYGNVFNEFGNITLKSIFGNLVHYLKAPYKFFEIPEFSFIIYGMTLPFFLIGMVKRFSKDLLYIVFLLVYSGMLLLYPANGDIRLLLPVMPFYIYFFIVGLEIIPCYEIKGYAKKIVGGNIFIGLFVLISFLAISYQSYQIVNGSARHIQGPTSKESKDLFGYIEKNTDKKSKIIFWKPRAMCLYTDRGSFFLNDVNKIITYKGCYVVEETGGDLHVSQDTVFIKNSELKFTNSLFKVYRIYGNDVIDWP